jgi:hypothetical protein
MASGKAVEGSPTGTVITEVLRAREAERSSRRKMKPETARKGEWGGDLERRIDHLAPDQKFRVSSSYRGRF